MRDRNPKRSILNYKMDPSVHGFSRLSDLQFWVEVYSGHGKTQSRRAPVLQGFGSSFVMHEVLAEHCFCVVRRDKRTKP